MSNSLEKIKDNYKFVIDKFLSYPISNDDFVWLIEQAETLQKISDTWVEIETNGTSEDADNFYTIVQDILTKKQD